MDQHVVTQFSSRERVGVLFKGLSIRQMMSCWGGMITLNTQIFVQSQKVAHNLSFVVVTKNNMNHLGGQKLAAMNTGHSDGGALKGHDSLRSAFV